MAIGNVAVMHECFPKHTHMGTANINKKKSDGLTVARAYRPTRVAIPQVVGELPN